MNMYEGKGNETRIGKRKSFEILYGEVPFIVNVAIGEAIPYFQYTWTGSKLVKQCGEGMEPKFAQISDNQIVFWGDGEYWHCHVIPVHARQRIELKSICDGKTVSHMRQVDQPFIESGYKIEGIAGFDEEELIDALGQIEVPRALCFVG